MFVVERRGMLLAMHFLTITFLKAVFGITLLRSQDLSSKFEFRQEFSSLYNLSSLNKTLYRMDCY